MMTRFPVPTPRAHLPIHVAHHGSFLRHLAEMTVVMMLGMVAGAALFTICAGFIAGTALTWDEARLRYPEACLLAIGVLMSVPMVAWMRYRGHGWRSGGEMTLAMVLPALGLIGLYWLDAVANTSLCGIYCAVMLPAMVVAMLVRRGEYSRHPAPISQAAGG